MSFDHEKLTVYKASIEFVAFAAKLLDKLKGKCGPARDQLLRSSQSIPLNIAEGNGKRSPADRRRFFEFARGSAMESAATLDVIAAIGACSIDEIDPGKAMLLPIVRMLSKMTEYNDTVAKESPGMYSESCILEQEQD